ncbi:NUDIX hydrolase [Marinicrinis lubricantis]|uniref:NUDIX hydrolase n=1 Tax=Marinicrinis lubricantis TaxID=2086470 RepID=A0ABW1ITE8_9BACL
MNETLEQAAIREIKEETGADIEITGVIGVYQNYNKGVIVSFAGRYVSGKLQSEEKEILDVRFVDLNQINLDEWFTRPHFKTRVTDALKGCQVPYESYAAKPYELLGRLEVKNNISK